MEGLFDKATVNKEQWQGGNAITALAIPSSPSFHGTPADPTYATTTLSTGGSAATMGLTSSRPAVKKAMINRGIVTLFSF